MVTPSMDVLDWLRKQLKEADADLLREMLSTFVQTLMGAEADALCNAPTGSAAESEATRATAIACAIGTRASEALISPFPARSGK